MLAKYPGYTDKPASELSARPTPPAVEPSVEPSTGQGSTWQEFLLQIIDSSFFASFFTIAGVVLGAWLTHKYTMESKVRQDNRERLIAVVMEALQCAEELLSDFRDYSRNAPYGGGRYRDSDDPDGPWKKLRKSQARVHAVDARAAVDRMLENSNKLQKLNVNLSVFAPNDLTESFQAIPARVTELFAALMEEGIHRGHLAQGALTDMEKLFNTALERTRDLAEVKFKLSQGT